MATSTPSKRNAVVIADTVTVSGNVSATDLTLSGNLTVGGTTTTLNTATLQVEDKNIVLNYGTGDTSGSANGAGITIQDAVNSSTNATMNWNTGTDRFDFSHHITVPSGNSSQWNTAYGWGNHASQGYLTSVPNHSAALLTSGTLPSARLNTDVWKNRGTINVTTSSGGSNSNPFDDAHTETRVAGYGSYLLSYTGASAHMISSAVGGSASVFQIGAHYNGDDFYMRVRTDSSNWKNWRKLWHTNNDGSGSGLDADLLDGQHGSHYLNYNNLTNKPSIPSVGNGTITINASGSLSGGGNFTVNQSGNSTITITGPTIPTSLPANGGNADTVDNLHAASFLRSDATDTSTGYLTFQHNDGIRVATNGSNPDNTTGTYYQGITVDGGNMRLNIDVSSTSNGGSYIQTRHKSSTYPSAYYPLKLNPLGGTVSANGHAIWHAGNDGSGSGLDADTLDGINSSSFLRSDATDTFTDLVGGTLEFDKLVYDWTGSTKVPIIELKGATSYGWFYHEGSPDQMMFSTSGNTNYELAFSSNYITHKGNTIWHAGNDGSGSGLDADTLDGLNLHTGRNNEVNKVVRTDSNGYIQAGWINTTSGNNGTTAISRIYASQDGYIRYYTPANFGSQISSHINYNSLQNKPTIPTSLPANGGNADTVDNFHVDANNGGLVKSYQDQGSGTFHSTISEKRSSMGMAYVSDGPNSGSDWYRFIQPSYREGSGGSNVWQTQLAFYGTGGDFYLRQREGGSFGSSGWGSWTRVWTSGTDGTGSGLDADLLDGQHGSFYLNAGNINAGTLPEARLPTISKYLRSDQDDTVTAGTTYTFPASDSPALISTRGNGGASLYVGGWSAGTNSNNIHRISSSSNLHIDSAANGNLYLNYYRGGTTYIGGNNVAWHAGNDGTGSGLDADTLDGKQHTEFGATLATYGTTAGASGRIRCTAPFNTNSAHMFQVTVSVYSSYTCHSYVVSGYMYPTTNQWHAPKCVYTGTGTPDIKVGRDANGKAYISIANAAYTGVRVHNMTRGYQTSVADTYDPWTITIDGATENSVTPTVSKVWHSTNDGTGSGLDADTVDGVHASSFVRRDGQDAGSVTIRVNDADFIVQDTSDSTTNYIWRHHTNQYLYLGTANAQPRTRYDLYTDVGSNKYWHAGNDGTGSGLDADLLDGQHGSYYLAYGNLTGTPTIPTIPSNNVVEGGTSYSGEYPMVARTSANTIYSHNGIKFNGAQNKLTVAGSVVINGGTSWHSGNDGSGSGLDADTVDGVQSTRIIYGDNSTGSTSSSPTNTLKSGFYNSSSAGNPTSTWYTTFHGRHTNTTNNYGHQIAGSFYSTGDIYNRNISNNTFGTWTKIWNASNDGSGSGLDADLLDGQQGSFYQNAGNLNAGTIPEARIPTISKYLRSDTSDTMSGELNVTRNGGVTGTSVPQYSDVNIELQTSSNHVPGISFHRGGYSATTLYEYDGELHVNAWTTRSQTGKLVSFGNDGSGSGLDADTLDGQHASAFLGATAKAADSNLLDGLDSTDYRQYTWRSFTVGGDLDKFYPALFSVGNGHHASSDLEISQSNVHQNGSSHGAFYARFGLNITGWGHVPQMTTLREYTKSGNTYISKIADTDHATGQIGIWLRGSTTYYYRCSDGAIFDSVRCTDNQPFKSYDHSNDAYDITITHATSVEDSRFNNSMHSGNVVMTSTIGNYAWTSANDGSGSGLDADTVDGQHASSFIDTSSSSQTKAGSLTIQGTTTLGNQSGDSTHINDTLFLGATDSGDSHFYFGENSSNWYGDHWYWDSGHEVERYSRHAGTDTLIEKHDTRNTHKLQVNRAYERLSHSTGYQIGSYNSVGGNSGNTNPIYTIGDNYRATDTALSNMYGIGYAHPNLSAWGSDKTSDWGMYVANNGSVDATIGAGAITAWFKNDVKISTTGALRTNRYENTDGTFMFRWGTNTGTSGFVNFSDSTADPSASSAGSNARGITWGQRTDNNPYYMIYPHYYNNGRSSHTRLRLAWHTGVEIGADPVYGGTRFYNNSPFTGSQIMSVGDGDSHVRVSNNLYVGSGTASAPAYSFSSDADSGMFSLGSNAVGFGTGGVQRFKINSNGLLLTGTSALYVNGQETISSGRSISNVVNYANTDGHMTLNRTGNAALIINRKGTTASSKGELLNFKSQNVKVGRIGYAEPYGGVMYLTTGNTIGCGVGVYSVSISGNTTGYFFPSTLAGGNFDNVMDLGASATRWDDVYATNGTIQTSDRNEKQDIQALTDAETAAATACKGLIRRFRWIDSVEEKGDDARYHFGAIAQDVESAFTAEGLDAGDYGLFIRSTWWEHEGHSYPSAAVAPTGAVEKTRLGIRYNQLFAFIISAL